MADQFEALVVEQMLDIAARAGEEIVDADDVGARSSSRSHRCEPRKPAPPVTKIRCSRCMETRRALPRDREPVLRMSYRPV